MSLQTSEKISDSGTVWYSEGGMRIGMEMEDDDGIDYKEILTRDDIIEMAKALFVTGEDLK